MEPEMMDDFELELQRNLKRRSAPPDLATKIMERRNQQRVVQIRHHRTIVWQRIAAAIVLAALLGGGFTWRQQQQHRKGEEARQQVLTALQITHSALRDASAQLTELNNDKD